MRRFAVVTTCHAEGFREYGRQMVETYVEHWPAEVPLFLYHEGFEPPQSPAISSRDLAAACPDLVAFKTRHADDPRANGAKRPLRRVRLGSFSIPLPVRSQKASYRWDAVRFSHKSYALFDASRRADVDVLIWIDADSVFFDAVTLRELEELVPRGSAVACLRRPTRSETGFVAYNLRHPETQRLLAEFEAMYSADLFWAEREYNDSHLFDVVRRRAERRGAWIHDIAEGVGWKAEHVLVNSRLGRFMDHLKGGRKTEGTSRQSDLVVDRQEAYWHGAHRGSDGLPRG